jgi:hypothetical protein
MARKQNNIHYIYKTTCNVTGRWYVGMHSTTKLDDGYMGSGTVLRHSIRKYGKDTHTKEILEYFDSRELLILREIEIVTKELIGDGKCMNLKEGGQGGFISDEHMMSCSKAGNNVHSHKFKTDEEYRNKFKAFLANIGKHSDNLRNDTFKNKKHSEESKKLISESMKCKGSGEANSQYGTCWITKDGLNKKIKKEDLETYLLDGWLKGRK